MSQKVAFVTGASRGIGKVCAIYLARAGYDVAISARTVNDGEPREHSPTLHKSDTKPLPGSLSATAAAVEAEGRQAMMVPADLLDRTSLGAATATVLERWGRIDVLINNGRYIGPGHMDRFTDTPIELLEKQLDANLLAPLILSQLVLPGMIERRSGTIVNITSASAYSDHQNAPGEGGWGLGYSVSKGGFHRVAGSLAPELAPLGIRVFNVQPGLIATERMAIDMEKFGFTNGAPAEVVGATISWLLTDPEADEWNGRNIEAQFFVAERKLLPEWAGPTPNQTPVLYDRSGAELERLERELVERS